MSLVELPPALFTGEGFLSRGPDVTRAVGAALAAVLARGAVVSLEGPLGAGKTQFACGMVEGLGCSAAASSPSFALMHEYAGGRLPVFHFDFYRMRDPGELITAGFDDCLPEGVTIVEWGDRFPGVLPEDAVRIRFALTSPEGRTLRASRRP